MKHDQQKKKINETQIMLSFPRIFKFNVVMYLYSIKEPNVPNIKNYTKVLP